MRILLADHERHARFCNAGLFGGDQLDGIAEILLVIERDARHDGHQRLDHVGAVEPPAEADLDDGDINAAGGEVGECNRGVASKKVAPTASIVGRRWLTHDATAISLIGMPLTRIRSRNDTRWGEV